MKQHNSAVIKKDAAQFEKWCFQQTVELEHTKIGRASCRERV